MKYRVFFYLMVLTGLNFLLACSPTRSYEYRQSHNGKALSVPVNLSSAEISHQYYLSSPKRPVQVSLKPPVQ